MDVLALGSRSNARHLETEVLCQHALALLRIDRLAETGRLGEHAPDLGLKVAHIDAVVDEHEEPSNLQRTDSKTLLAVRPHASATRYIVFGTLSRARARAHSQRKDAFRLETRPCHRPALGVTGRTSRPEADTAETFRRSFCPRELSGADIGLPRAPRLPTCNFPVSSIDGRRNLHD